ncbi:putative RIN4, pathogenic type III effector avirulence factor Avr cleavage [Medicago truncatula]|uniref:Putative RIN4, pathogenic type III effector avirulence factor Avr cleavage n=1 Tax=Medicago truncatula TaxID=3880 RepID=A0A396ICX2_MEDTR|nr:protein NOI4 [Medicago truncatula]RHN63412.1 putative RIN4, pathogenic type III effector avirulence factor Avr cleavage [Medicago truncatula]
MASQDKGRPLPKFGEWDVNNPASAEGFTVIFNKARDEKKTNTSINMATPRTADPVFKNDNHPKYPRKSKWFCCG